MPVLCAVIVINLLVNSLESHSSRLELGIIFCLMPLECAAEAAINKIDDIAYRNTSLGHKPALYLAQLLVLILQELAVLAQSNCHDFFYFIGKVILNSAETLV